MRELLLLRHAKSAWDTGAPSDFERPLNPRGERDAPRVGAWLEEQGLVPDLVVSSPARRAERTALHVAEALDLDPASILWDDRIYDAGLGSLFDVLAGCPSDRRRVLLVGHNPGLETLVLYLARGDVSVPRGAKLMPTAAMAHFRVQGPWEGIQEAACTLLGILRPRELGPS